MFSNRSPSQLVALRSSTNISSTLMMIYLLTALYLFFITLITALVLPLPLALTTNVTALDAPGIVCTEYPIYRHDPRPNLLDCERAIQQLLSRVNTGIFRTTGANPSFQLPLNEKYDSCKVIVDMLVPSLQDKSSWKLLQSMTQRVAERCFEEKNWGDVLTGGSVMTGKEYKILVRLKHA